MTEVKIGCSRADFAEFPAGNVALIREGDGCELVDKALLAEDVSFLFSKQLQYSEGKIIALDSLEQEQSYFITNNQEPPS